MNWLTKATLSPLCIGILLSSFAWDCLAQNSPQIQNQVKLDYEDTIGVTTQVK